MSLFFGKYSLDVNSDYDTTLGLFRESLDDMSQKGYSMTKYVVHNSDHKGRPFSGAYRDGAFVVRQTDSGTDDFYYRMLPSHRISFESTGSGVRVNIKSKSSFLFFVFLFIAAIAMLVLTLLALGCVLEGLAYTRLLYALIPVAAGIAPALYSRHLIDDTRTTFRYIYKDYLK